MAIRVMFTDGNELDIPKASVAKFVRPEEGIRVLRIVNNDWQNTVRAEFPIETLKGYLVIEDSEEEPAQ
jgi:hypothetical protein